MARFLYWSDLHQEHAPFPLPDGLRPGEVDALLLGGDIANAMNTPDFALEALRAYTVPVLFVLGNHDYYGQNATTFERALRQRINALRDAGLDVDWLTGQARVIAGTRVIGTTLWTDLCPVPHDTPDFKQALDMKDYQRILIDDGAQTRFLAPQDTRAWHQAQAQALFEEARKPFDGPTLVMTHHLPSYACIHLSHTGQPLNHAFASNLDDRIRASTIDWWLYGHTHQPTNIDMARTDGGICRLRANPLGYPHERETSRFNPYCIIDTTP